MDVINVVSKIPLIPNQVLPITPLPDAPLSFPLQAGGYDSLFRHLLGKRYLDQTPALCEIIITLRQGPEGMKMIRQHHHRFDIKGMLPLHLGDDVA